VSLISRIGTPLLLVVDTAVCSPQRLQTTIADRRTPDVRDLRITAEEDFYTAINTEGEKETETGRRRSRSCAASSSRCPVGCRAACPEAEANRIHRRWPADPGRHRQAHCDQADHPDAQIRLGKHNHWEIWPPGPGPHSVV
jgi:hypothetical protein